MPVARNVASTRGRPGRAAAGRAHGLPRRLRAARRQDDDAAAIGSAPAAPPLSPLERRFVRAVSARLQADGIAIVWRRDADHSLALRLAIDGQTYWLPLHGVLAAREFTGAWLAASISAGLLALLGALAIQRHIGRPLGSWSVPPRRSAAAPDRRRSPKTARSRSPPSRAASTSSCKVSRPPSANAR